MNYEIDFGNWRDQGLDFVVRRFRPRPLALGLIASATKLKSRNKLLSKTTQESWSFHSSAEEREYLVVDWG
jgi:hypothetical protein